MKEVTIKYKSNKTLDALRDMGKHLGFTVDEPKENKPAERFFINNVPVIRGDDSIDITELETIFTGKGLNADEVRKSGWQRKK
jgi:hypothetical protein